MVPLSQREIESLLSSFIFLTTRHTWNLGYLSMPEFELFEVIQTMRPNLIGWMNQNIKEDRPKFNAVLDNTYFTAIGEHARDANGVWCCIRGVSHGVCESWGA